LQKSPFGGFSGSRGLAVGAGAGFIGGAVAGIAAVSMYHQYRQFQSLLYCHNNPVCYGPGYGMCKILFYFINIFVLMPLELYYI
jgi:hypothetical protein